MSRAIIHLTIPSSGVHINNVDGTLLLISVSFTHTYIYISVNQPFIVCVARCYIYTVHTYFEVYLLCSRRTCINACPGILKSLAALLTWSYATVEGVVLGPTFSG